jgi:hypothetical protein
VSTVGVIETTSVAFLLGLEKKNETGIINIRNQPAGVELYLMAKPAFFFSTMERLSTDLLMTTI